MEISGVDAEFIMACPECFRYQTNISSLVASPIFFNVVDREGKDKNLLFATHHQNSTVGKLRKRANHAIHAERPFSAPVIAPTEMPEDGLAWGTIETTLGRSTDAECFPKKNCVDAPAASEVGVANCSDLEDS
jgi:hypothetical protein